MITKKIDYFERIAGGILSSHIKKPQTVSKMSLSRPIQNFENIPTNQPDEIVMITYNVTANFFDKPDYLEHHWENRKEHVFNLVSSFNPDCIAWQELSLLQAKQVVERYPNHNHVFLSQTPSDIPVGLVMWNNDIGAWKDAKNIGTPLIGISISKSLTNIEDVDIIKFWYSKTPNTPPSSDDIKNDPNAYLGNTRTARAFFGVVFKCNDKKILFSTSHYPLSGDNKTRSACAKLEIEKVYELLNNNSIDYFFITGDRNTIPTKETDYFPESVYDEFLKLSNDVNTTYDLRDGCNHYGSSLTFTGFKYEPKHLHFGVDMDDKPLDLFFSNIKSTTSFYHPGAYNDKGLISLADYNEKKTEINEARLFASDHCLVGGYFNIL